MTSAKREHEASDNEASGSRSANEQTAPKKKQRTVKSKYSTEEERRFVEAWFELGKEGLWQKLKNDPELGKRGANGIRSHLEAMVKKLLKEV